MGSERPMRRRDREISDPAELREILDANNTAVLSMIDDGEPYGVMMNYAPVYEGDEITLLFHSALAGRKIDCLRRNPAVSILINDFGRTKVIDAGARGFDWTTHYRSAVLTGNVRFIDDFAERRPAAERFMRHYYGGPIELPDAALRATLFFEVKVERITGKQNPSPSQMKGD